MQALNINGAVWGGDVDPQAVARLEVDNFWEMPSLTEVDGPELAAACQDRGIGLLIPTRDGELDFFARHRRAFSDAGIFIPIGSEESVATANDKLEFADTLIAAGIPAIPTTAYLDAESPDRLVVKERCGAGSASTVIDVSRDAASMAAGGMSEPVFQPYVRGVEFSADLYIDQAGECLGVLVRERSRVVHGESQVTTVCGRPDIAELAKAVALTIGIRGHAVVQILEDGNKFHVIECNSRVGGASSGAWLNGLRTVDAMLLESIGETPTPLTPRSEGTTVVRIPSDRVLWL